MHLNIKDYHVHAQAKQLAKLTGENITQVVRVALADRLIAIKQSQRQFAATAKAKERGEPLLFKGYIFGETVVMIAK